MLQFNSFPQVGVKKRSKKNQGKKNPFFYVMLEKREEWKTEGRFYNMKELAEECQPHWDLLQTNPKMIEPYKRMAEEFKEDSEGKLDCHGRPLKALELEAEKREKQWANLEAEEQQLEEVLEGLAEGSPLKEEFEKFMKEQLAPGTGPTRSADNLTNRAGQMGQQKDGYCLKIRA